MNERGRGYELDNRLLVFGNECGSKERYLLLGWFHLFIQAMILLNLALCIWRYPRYPPADFRWLKDVSCCCAGGHKTLNLPVLLFFSVQSRPEEAKNLNGRGAAGSHLLAAAGRLIFELKPCGG